MLPLFLEYVSNVVGKLYAVLVGGYTVLQPRANRFCSMRGEIDITPLKQSPRPTKVSHMRGIENISSPR